MLFADLPLAKTPARPTRAAKGVDGERTGLFFEAIRLVGELRPRWVCLENVPGLRARGYDRIQDALEALDYECRPVVVGAWHAGAPHRRNRVVVVANLSTVFPNTVAGRQSDRAGARAAADASQSIAVRRTAIGGRIGGTETAARDGAIPDAHSDGLWLQPGRRSGAHGSETTEPQGGVARNADGAGTGARARRAMRPRRRTADRYRSSARALV